MNKTLNLYDDERHLTPDNMVIAQSLLDQTRSIDEAAELMCESDRDTEYHKWLTERNRWQKLIMRAVSDWTLVI